MAEVIWLQSCLHLGHFMLLWHCKGGMNYAVTHFKAPLGCQGGPVGLE